MSLRELLDWDLEQFRKETAGLDAYLTIKDVLVDSLNIDENEIDAIFEDEDCEDYDDYDCDYDEEEDGSYDEVDMPSLTSEEERLADRIVDDINNGRYTIDAIRGLYSDDVISYIENYTEL